MSSGGGGVGEGAAAVGGALLRTVSLGSVCVSLSLSLSMSLTSTTRRSKEATTARTANSDSFRPGRHDAPLTGRDVAGWPQIGRPPHRPHLTASSSSSSSSPFYCVPVPARARVCVCVCVHLILLSLFSSSSAFRTVFVGFFFGRLSQCRLGTATATTTKQDTEPVASQKKKEEK